MSARTQQRRIQSRYSRMALSNTPPMDNGAAGNSYDMVFLHGRPLCVEISECIHCGPARVRVRSKSQLATKDLTLPIAGPGTRAYAFVIDWHIRLLIALAW